MRDCQPDTRFYVQQQDVMYSGAPASGVPVTVLDSTMVRLIAVAARITWTVQPQLEVRIITPAESYNGLHATPVSNTWYYLGKFEPASTVQASIQLLPYDADQDKAFIIEGKDIQVLVEATGGTYTNVRCNVIWSRYI